MDFSEEITDEIFKIFQVESEEIISKINNSLLDLEKKPSNKDVILVLFRDAHTLKGASRMVGFNSAQTLAHKMEDILGLAKENKIVLNSKIINILYKTVDILSELIEKSIEKGKEVYNDEVSKQINILEHIEDYTDDTQIEEELSEFDSTFLIQNIDKINEFIVQALFILLKLQTEKNENLIDELLLVVTELYNDFDKISSYEIKKALEDIKVKLEFISKASKSLTPHEVDTILQTINGIIDKLIPICELYNLKTVDYYSLVFERFENNGKANVEIEESLQMETPDGDNAFLQEVVEESTQPRYEGFEVNNSQIQLGESYNLEIIQEGIVAAAENGSSLVEIKDFLVSFEQECQDKNVKNVIQKIIKILNFVMESEIKLDSETASVIEQSIEYCDNIIKNKTEVADKELILQRLEIIQQILELNNQVEEDNNLVAKNKYKIKSKGVPDFSEIFNASEIKTLRVDSAKLDTLVNQINELMITKIKAKKHLLELNLVNKELAEWQKNSVKTLSFLKYYDKKYFQSAGGDNPISFFIKQLLTLFSENNQKVQDAVAGIVNLQRMVQEDDTKTSLIVDNLEQMVKDIRVLPLATVFHLFGRMVRDIAQEKGKKIELKIIGSETCTDKKIIEEIKAPLIHIIRNAIDHGIETPEERIELGKNPEGEIILSARQFGSKVIIEIEDNGRGINIEKIKEKAVQKGYLTREEANSMSDEQITNIIFSPGFSTGESITNISGRGIGLDVVQTKISQLNGKVKVISEVNKGCCVQIELPTTMSTLKAFLVKSANQTFAIPMDAINTVLRKRSDEIILNKGKKSIIFKEKSIPLFSLAEILNLEQSVLSKDKATILILENESKIIALSVDKLMGDQEILHKKLSAPLYKLKNISGVTTLISGEICFILNILDLMNTVVASKIQINSSTSQKLLLNTSYKILLVDDSITTRTLEKNILTKAGYVVETAQNPIEAFEIMKLIRFDLIITDIEMPEMNGFEFLEKLKTDEMFSDIPVIVVSSLLTEENKKRSAELGAEKYIVKNDFNQEEFQDTISKILVVNEG